MSDSASSSEDNGTIPYYLMPVAAMLGMCAVYSFVRLVYNVYRRLTYDKSENPPAGLWSRPTLVTAATLVLSLVGYGYVCALVNHTLEGPFDPYDILRIDGTANATCIKAAYRSLSKRHHPDKGGDGRAFHDIHLAYRALTQDRANWERHGHPDGPQRHPSLSFALPPWLLHPQGKVALALISLYLFIIVAVIRHVIRFVSPGQTDENKQQLDDTSVAGADAAYLARNLTPDATHLDVLFLIATSPENIQIADMEIERAKRMKRDRLVLLKKMDNQIIFNDDDDDGGWAKDDDEGSEAAKLAEKQRAIAAAQLAQATGKTLAQHIKIEGLDRGVIGQVWVESTLTTVHQWPPPTLDTGMLSDKTFSNNNGAVGPLEHEGVRRNLCMTMGRLNAQMLNSHPELVEAGANNLIDSTYFKSTMEFRQRTGLLLEAALRIAITARSYRLAKTIIEVVSMFKIGTRSHDDTDIVRWFTDLMVQQYGGENGIPRLEIGERTVETLHEEIVVDDSCALQFDVDRTHAENFTKQKIASCQKQGIPPQVVLQAYREIWWILIRAKKMNDEDGTANVAVREPEQEADELAVSSIAKERARVAREKEVGTSPLHPLLDNTTGDAKRFGLDEESNEENRLIGAWPFLVSNVAQKCGRVKVRFQAPHIPGKYKILVDVKSQEFLGADQSFDIETNVIESTAKQQQQQQNDETMNDNDDDSNDDEAKKNN